MCEGLMPRHHINPRYFTTQEQIRTYGSISPGRGKWSSTNSICQSSCQSICSLLTLFDPKSYQHDGKVWHHESNRKGKSRLALKGFAAHNTVYDHHKKTTTKNSMKYVGFSSDEEGEQPPFSFSMFTHLSVRMCINRTWKFLSHFCCW